MLHNYKRNASLKNWCIKSTVFAQKGFCTPTQLTLYEVESSGYAYIRSKLLYLAIHNQLAESDMDVLLKKLIELKFYESLGFDDLPSTEVALNQLEKIEKKTVVAKLPKAKALLIRLVLERKVNIDNCDLMTLYNKIISVKVKAMNKTSVRSLPEQL